MYSGCLPPARPPRAERVRWPGDRVAPYHPAASSPEQRAGQEHEPERQHPDVASAADVRADVMTGQPDHRRRAQHARQAEPGVRLGYPAEEHQNRQHREADPGHRARRHRATDQHRLDPARREPTVVRSTVGS